MMLPFFEVKDVRKVRKEVLTPKSYRQQFSPNTIKSIWLLEALMGYVVQTGAEEPEKEAR